MSEQSRALWHRILLAQKQEFEILAAEPYVERLGLVAAQKLLTSPLAKVILGPRRAGKSIFALQLCKNQKTAYCNFDDDELIHLVKQDGIETLITELKEVYGECHYYLFDEIQNLEGWELIVNKLNRRKFNLILTGSNANLLSQELTTHLTGRYHEFRILPFCWSEYVSFMKDGATLNDYVTRGGYPEILRHNIPHYAYLSQLAESILLKDIVRRYQVRQVSKLAEMWYYLRAEFTRLHSITKLATTLGFSSKTTAQNYLEYLKQVYLVHELPKYSFKYRQQLVSPKKSYLIDVGFVRDTDSTLPTDGRRLENLVFLELLRRSYASDTQLYYYQTRQGYEVDFIERDGNSCKALIQAAYSVQDSETLEREKKALIAAAQELSCDNLTIVTLDQLPPSGVTEFTEAGKVISVVNLQRFLEL